MAAILFTDADGTWKLHNGKPWPGSRFSSWTPTSAPHGDSAAALANGALTMLRLRTDFGVSFELPMIPSVRSTNHLLRPEEFEHASWSKANITVTANDIVAPDGSPTGDKLAATATAATSTVQGVGSFPGSTATYSIYARMGTGAAIGNRFGIRNSTTAADLIFVEVNYSTQAITYIVGTTGARVHADGNGYLRVIMSAASGITAGADTLVAYVGWSGNTATAGDYLHAWGAQLEPGLIATPYLYTTSAARSGVSMLEIADRLRYHLINGGTCAVYPNDPTFAAYTTCGLRPGTEPQIQFTDRRTIEYSLSLELLNVAGSPTRMLAAYAG